MSRLAVASLVVLAILVGTAAAAAPDRRSPRLVAGVMLDRDRDQRSDGVRLTYSEPVRHRVDRDGAYPFSLRGYRIQSVSAARGRTLLLRLVEKPRLDAGARPLVHYRRTKAKPVLDRSGKQAVAQSFRGVRPLARIPVVVPPPAPAPPPPDQTAPPDLDPDRDGYVAPADCKPNDSAVHPGADDLPDLGFGDTNCDGIDGTEAKAVFASPQGNDANPGTRDKPKRQIQAAVTAAAASGRYVLAATGGYGGVVVASGVGVYGGYDQKSWRRPSEGETEIIGSPEGVLAVGAKDITLQLLSIRSIHNGASAYGIRAINSSSLRLQRVTVAAGAGAAGAAGVSGSAGRAGGAGADGMKGSCDAKGTSFGGAGGKSVVGRDGGSGGNGHYESRGSDGATGLVGTPGGKGGSAGSQGGFGDEGGNGSDGAPGAAGAGGTGSTVLASETWRGQAGIEGIYGAPGNGGGGGGASGGQTGAFVVNGTGNAGSGGGGGGEGGRGGQGGAAGGGSFGIYLQRSAVVADSSSITAGSGGPGGRGGNGGPGGPGGGGGAWITYCGGELGRGGHGGRGGNGGPGGDGGGGAGGPSIAVMKVASSSAVLTATAVVVGSGGAGGAPGIGGAAAGSGQPGIVQAIYP